MPPLRGVLGGRGDGAGWGVEDVEVVDFDVEADLAGDVLVVRALLDGEGVMVRGVEDGGVGRGGVESGGAASVRVFDEEEGVWTGWGVELGTDCDEEEVGAWTGCEEEEEEAGGELEVVEAGWDVEGGA